MGTQYFCQNERRRQVLRDSPIDLNGIDYLEVLDEDAPEEKTRQRTLLVRMLKPVPAGLSAANVRIEGGVRVTAVNVHWALRAADAVDPLFGQGVTEEPTAAEKAYFLRLPKPQQVLAVRTNSNGDFSTYRLRLVATPTSDAPPSKFDPMLSTVEFSFKVECPNEFDCAPELTCPPESGDEPVIDYLAKDYSSFRQLMLDRLGVIMPDWTERNPADLGIALVELLAYAADSLSYYQDAVATEAYLETARLRTSVRRHARLLDYPMHDGCNARTWVHVQVTVDDLAIARGTPFLTRVTGLPRRIAQNSPNHVQALSQQPVVFEAMQTVNLFRNHNCMHFYTWGDERCCLPIGATRATLRGHLPNLQAGAFLVFVEARGPAGSAAEADLTHRHAVRLVSVTPGEDQLGGQFALPPTTDAVAVTEIEWMAADALPFPLCLWTVEVPNEEVKAGDDPMQPVTVALGNIVLADHGQTLPPETVQPLPQQKQRRPPLQQRNITVCMACDEEDDPVANAAAHDLLVQDPRQALPYVRLKAAGETWKPQRDLLASDRFASEFVVETEENGRAYLRFGNGTYGREPTAGTQFLATYRIGNGQAGNIGADALYHVVSNDSGITALGNPLPAQGGVAPETIPEVRLYAPQAFRTQERAITEQDYATVAERHPHVQSAVATRRWTGSWYTIFLTVDRKGGLPVDAAFEQTLRLHLEQYRLAGHDLEIDGPRFVALDIAFTVCVEPDYFRSDVKAALLETFSSQDLPSGKRGFFHPDNFTFGQPVYLSQIVAAAMQVPGVRWIDTSEDTAKPHRFKRWGEPARDELASGLITLGRLEVAQLSNNASIPEGGKIDFFMEGGI